MSFSDWKKIRDDFNSYPDFNSGELLYDIFSKLIIYLFKYLPSHQTIRTQKPGLKSKITLNFFNLIKYEI